MKKSSFYLFSRKIIFAECLFIVLFIHSTFALTNLHLSEFPEIKKTAFKYVEYSLKNSLLLYNDVAKKQKLSMNAFIDLRNTQKNEFQEKFFKSTYSYKHIGELAFLCLEESDYMGYEQQYSGVADKIFNFHYGNFIDALPLKGFVRPIALVNLDYFSIRYKNYPKKYLPKYLAFDLGAGVKAGKISSWGILASASFYRSKTVFPTEQYIAPGVEKNGFIINGAGVYKLLNTFTISANAQFLFNDQFQDYFYGAPTGLEPIRGKTYDHSSLLQSYSVNYRQFCGKFNYDKYSLKLEGSYGTVITKRLEWLVGVSIVRNSFYIGIWHTTSNRNGPRSGMSCEYEFLI